MHFRGGGGILEYKALFFRKLHAFCYFLVFGFTILIPDFIIMYSIFVLSLEVTVYF